MHSHTYETKEYGGVVVLVNGDWSGEATVRWNFRGQKDYSEAVLPAALLLEISKRGAVEAVRDTVISALERL